MILAPGGTDTPSGLFIKGAVLSSFHTFRLDYDINTKTVNHLLLLGFFSFYTGLNNGTHVYSKIADIFLYHCE